MSLIFQRLPIEVQQNIVFMLTNQADLVSLSSVSKLYHELSVKSLYSKIYLNDSCIEPSNVWPLAPTWTWLPLSDTRSNIDEETSEANEKFALLVRTIEENPELCNNIIQVRLNWDLDIDLQLRFIKIITTHSKSLRVLENITHPVLNDTILNNNFTANLLSLDLPPPNPIPSIEVDEGYIPWLRNTLQRRLEVAQNTGIKTLTVFMDPILLFNNIVKLNRKLEVESFKIHCRADAYPNVIYSRNSIKKPELKDIFDVKSLKELTIISWFDQYLSPDKLFRFDQWSEFRNLQDITLISVTFEDERVSKMINNCYCLKRLKLDFSQPQREINPSTLIYQSIFNHKKSLEFLDVKLKITNKIVNLDLRNHEIVVKIPCPCHVCQIRVLKNIFQDKILPTEEDYKIRNNNFQHFPQIDYFCHFATSSLSPYSKAVDRYPSVKTGPDDIQSFLERFNDDNSHREQFVPLNTQDFYDLYQCLVHNMKPDMEPFVNGFPKLKCMVLNDIAFLIKKSTDFNGRFPLPLFYTEGFTTNFDIKYENNLTSVDELFYYR